MNEDAGHHELTAEEQRTIDLLIDGELDEAARHELLSSLDYTSDGWRQLALGFLEAQTLRQEFSQLVAPAAPAATAIPRCVPRRSERVQSGWGTLLLAMAASFLLAFGLAMLIRGDTFHGGKGAEGVGVPLASSPHAGDNQNDQVEGLVVRPLSEPKRATSLVEVTHPDGSAVPAVLPVVAGKTAANRFDRNAVSALPRHVQQALERMGHRVQKRRQLVPIQLPDGRRVVLPVEEIDVQFVGSRPYQ